MRRDFRNVQRHIKGHVDIVGDHIERNIRPYFNVVLIPKNHRRQGGKIGLMVDFAGQGEIAGGHLENINDAQ